MSESEEECDFDEGYKQGWRDVLEICAMNLGDMIYFLNWMSAEEKKKLLDLVLKNVQMGKASGENRD